MGALRSLHVGIIPGPDRACVHVGQHHRPGAWINERAAFFYYFHDRGAVFPDRFPVVGRGRDCSEELCKSRF